MFNKSLIIICLVLLNSLSHAQGFLKTSGKAIVDEQEEPFILRGMGLGGWMLQEGYMIHTAEFANAQHQFRQKISDLIGPDRTEEFYNAWLANHVTKRDIDSLKAWGFNSVRLPMHYNLYTLPIEEEPIQGQITWLDKGFEMTDSLISWCASNNMYVVLDLHAAPGGQGYDQGISDYDTSKPSLWESELNQDKTVALWKRLAERYKDEKWVAGYDLLNETNWDIPGGLALKNLYKEITDSIRTVDQKHIIFIEGNWFANDFTGLTPPWDDNIVYSPHKYWSTNDQASIQWVLDIRNTHNVPLYLGESGENSNVWFQEAIALLEEHDIGWAWWPLKKIESISCPLSVTRTEEYDQLLDYWKGSAPKPNEDDAFATLMAVAEDLKIENCRIQYDVIDAMFRQINSKETIPYNTQNIPGVVYASDYDIGRIGEAYNDNEYATFHVSTGNYTAWNNGWSYRNDGVDIEPCNDLVNSNGYNVGWIESGDWMQYDVDVDVDAAYNIRIRYATEQSNSRILFKVGEATLTPTYTLPSTNSWQSWQDFVIPNIYLGTSDNKLRLYAEEGGVNISSFEFIQNGSGSTVPMSFVDATTVSEEAIQVFVNKGIVGDVSDISDFEVTLNGESVPVTNVSVRQDNQRIIDLSVNAQMIFTDIIRVSYSGTNIQASDNTSLVSYSNELVKNLLNPLLNIPGKIETEDYTTQFGVELESTTDLNGGLNIAFLDSGDYLEYDVIVEEGGEYDVFFRLASEQSSGSFRLTFIDRDGVAQESISHNVSGTGGWQNWQTSQEKINLTSGVYKLRLDITNGPFNFNWIDFLYVPGEEEEEEEGGCEVCIYPNPVSELLTLDVNFTSPHDLSVKIYDLYGRIVHAEDFGYSDDLKEAIDLAQLVTGQYVFELIIEDDTQYLFKFVKH